MAVDDDAPEVGAGIDEDAMVPVPTTGRVFTRERRVRLGDASPAGRLRLDALARYLQDVSNDDTRDAAMADAMTWVVRRILLRVETFPVFDEAMRLRTFCSGTGPRWAARRVSLDGERGGAVEADTLWVFVDGAGRPAPSTNTQSVSASTAPPRSPSSDTRRAAHRGPVPLQNVRSRIASSNTGKVSTRSRMRRTTHVMASAMAASRVSSLDTSWR